jgi:ubiquinone/menaquinone biosynthesis C-methylase UbiE
LQQLGTEWLPAIPDVHARLQAEPPALVADIGCGLGWSSIGIAQAYPNVQVDGFDLDGPSIEMARDNLAGLGLDGRVNFHERDAGDPSLAGRYDLVTAFECVHDMSDPVSALRTARRLAGEQGAVLVVDERVGDVFTPNGNEVEWMMYGWSVLHCLPVGMAEEPSAATGTVMRTDTLRQYAREAGFREVEVLPIENFFFRFYRLWV